MQIIFIFGRPAVGKLTVAREVARQTGFRLFDNHLIVDAAVAVYDFGTPGFIALREALWRAAFTEIARVGELPGVIFTFNPEDSVPQQFIDELFALWDGAKVPVRCIELIAPEAVIEERLRDSSRASKRKLVDLSLYRQLRESGVFESPVINRNRLVLDTSELSPTEAASRIAEGLPRNAD